MDWIEHEHVAVKMLDPGYAESKPLAAQIGMPYSTFRAQMDGTRNLSLRAFWLPQIVRKDFGPLNYLLSLRGDRITTNLESEPEAPTIFQGLVRVGEEMGHLYASVEQAVAVDGQAGVLITKDELAISEQMANRMHAQIDAVMRSMRRTYDAQFQSAGRQLA
jgi:hypothetical protein